MRNNVFWKGVITVMGLAALLALSGCGKTDASKRANSSETDSEFSEELSEKVLSFDKNAKNGNTSVTINSGSHEVDSSDDSLSDSSVDSSDDDSKLIGNNKFFIQYGDDVYFHIMDPRETQTVMWSDFLLQECGNTGLYSVNANTGEVQKLKDDQGWGKLSKSGDFIFYNAYSQIDGVKEKTLGVLELGGASLSESETIGESYLIADDKGQYTIAYSIDFDNPNSGKYVLWIYDNGKRQEPVYVDGYPNPVGISEDDFFFILSVEKEDYVYDYYLMDLDLVSHSVINLGLLPEEDYGGFEVDQYEYSGDNIYFSYGNYDGTGHFFQGGYFVSAEAGKEDSVTYEEQTWSEGNSDRNEIEDTDYLNSSSPFYLKDGRMIPCDGIPGAASVVGDTIGYYDNEGKWVPVASGGYAEISENSGEKITHYEAVELLGDKIFAFMDTSVHEQKDDIGWRYAYKRLLTNYFFVDINSGERDDFLEVELIE